MRAANERLDFEKLFDVGLNHYTTGSIKPQTYVWYINACICELLTQSTQYTLWFSFLLSTTKERADRFGFLGKHKYCIVYRHRQQTQTIHTYMSFRFRCDTQSVCVKRLGTQNHVSLNIFSYIVSVISTNSATTKRSQRITESTRAKRTGGLLCCAESEDSW